MSKPLYDYLLTFIDSEDKSYKQDFCCSAEDIPHAIEQLENAYPGKLTIIKIERGQIEPDVTDEPLDTDYKYIIYSGLTDQLLTTDVFDCYEDAVEYISNLNDQVIIRIRI
jgi:hypothetical protein